MSATTPKEEHSADPDAGSAAPHARTAEEMTRALGVSPDAGLSGDEVARRREAHGPNRLPEAKQRSLWRMLLDQFASLIVLLLVAAAVVAGATGEVVEAVAIFVVLLINALVGFLTELRARQALDALRQQARATARVRRDGRESQVDAEELVPGDVVLLAAGDRVPADLRLLTAASVRAEESALTGESVAVEKNVEPSPADAPVAERHGMLFLGTTLAAGSATAVVVATGPQTELGHIGKLVSEAEEEATPLEKRLDDLGKRLVFLVIGIAAAVFALGWARGLAAAPAIEGERGGLWRLAETAISLAVAAVPEGLPAVTTLVLALGVLRMAKQNALVRKLSAVETLGSTTVICSDKTGTLTQNRMTVQLFRLADGSETPLTDDDAATPFEPDSLLGRAVRVSVLCNEAALDGDSEDGAQGDPTETALVIAAARRLGVDPAKLRADYPMRDEIPFDSDTKRMVTLHAVPEGAGTLLALKGAPASVLDLCAQYVGERGEVRPFDEATRERFLAANNEMADRALRVLGLAEKRADAAPESIPEEERLGGYTLLGFVGMMDPPRPEAKEAVARAHGAGIRTVMLTGDQVRTAQAIARDLRLDSGGSGDPIALHARDLTDTHGEALAQKAREVDVFARVSPEEKLRIVEALQNAGEVVAVTGDGVNDAPALKKADIGIAMGQRGTEVAKEAADMVLADDNFTTIVRAIEGGRTIYANILKFVHLLFTCNLSEVLVIFAAVAVGWPLPLLPLQILWVNLVTDIFPALALAVEPPAPDVMERKPRSPNEALLSREFLGLIAWQGALLAAVVLAAYWWALKEYGPGAHARTIALLSLVGVQLGQTFNCRSRSRSAFFGLRPNPWVWWSALMVVALQALVVYLPPLSRVMGVTPPNPTDYFVVALSVVIPVVVVEIAKPLFYRKK